MTPCIVAPMDQEILIVFFYDVRCAVVMHFSAWSGEIRTTIETITVDMLHTVWKELDFRVDVCRITKGAHTGCPRRNGQSFGRVFLC